MITVRFSNGQAVQYNNGWFVNQNSYGSWIYESDKKKILYAFIPYSKEIRSLKRKVK